VLAAAASAGVLFLSAGTLAAYAVTNNVDVTATVEINSLTEAAALQERLRGRA
jgi:hypothetical protein